MIDKTSKIVIIGGGLAGLTSSWFLQKEGFSNVTILEKSTDTTMEASGLNSGLIRHFHPDQYFREELVRGISLLRSYQEQKQTSFYEEAPSLWLIRPDVFRDLTSSEEKLVQWKQVQPDQVPSSFHPAGDVEQIWITFEQDGLLDSVELGDLLKREIKHSSVSVQTGVEVKEGRKTNETWELTMTSGKQMEADRIVNAAGSWANVVGERLGLKKMNVEPVRRHLFYIDRPLVPDRFSYFMDHHNRFFLRRTDRGTLISYCDELPVEPGESTSNSYPEDHLDNVIGGSYPDLDLGTVDQYWSGTYAMTPERKPIIKPDPEEPSVIWATGLNDFGMSYAFRLGEKVSELVTK